MQMGVEDAAVRMLPAMYGKVMLTPQFLAVPCLEFVHTIANTGHQQQDFPP